MLYFTWRRVLSPASIRPISGVEACVSALTRKELDRINHVNSGLMLVSAALAYFFPFHTFLLAFVILGPLHYLTQINWMHGKQYFTAGRWDFVVLAGLALLDTYARRLGVSGWVIAHNTVRIALFSALAMVLIKDTRIRIGGIAVAFLLAYVPVGPGPALFFSLYLSTIVHVYVLTWLFLLHGALKSKSRSGYVSVAVHTALGIGLLFAPPVWTRFLPESMTDALSALGNLNLHIAHTFGWDLQGTGPFRAMQLVAFAYTYHYLNWFSKTRLIQWHRVSRTRLAVIGGLYALFLGLYAYDFRIGLGALLAISLGHVFLEFPLNLKTAAGIVVEIKARLAPAPPQKKSKNRKHRRAA